MRYRVTYIICAALFLIVGSCKKPYYPTLSSSSVSYLVVEGMINSGPDSTFIKLSRTIPVSARQIQPETGASVTVESDNGATFPLIEKKKGLYVIGPMALANGAKYRLRIKTANGSEYASDLQASIKNPPIDSVGFIAQPNGLDIYVNTHDPANNTHYYLWNYDETWRFHALYYSGYVSDGVKMISRADQIYDCFANDTSTSIGLGSSAKLTQDVIFQSPITHIDASSEKIELKYSIKVRQYALTKEAFTFWTGLKKISEQLGNIFDAQPSQLKSNIHNVKNAAEPVIGYISVTNVQTKRVFINREQMPDSYTTHYPFDCEQDSAFFSDPHNNGINTVQALLIHKPAAGIATGAIIKGGPNPIGYLYSSRYCADCTIRGTVKQPDFWK